VPLVLTGYGLLRASLSSASRIGSCRLFSVLCTPLKCGLQASVTNQVETDEKVTDNPQQRYAWTTLTL